VPKVIGEHVDNCSISFVRDSGLANHTKGSGLQWFVRRGAAVTGPFSSARVRHFVLEGTLDSGAEVSRDQCEWHRVGEVAEVIPLQMRSDDEGLGAAQAAQRRDERRSALLAIVVSSLVLGGLVLGTLLLGVGDRQDPRDCTAAPAPGLMLEGCRLSRADFARAPLARARLANANLTDAILTEADLGAADLKYAALDGANLAYASLRSAVLKGASLRFTDLTNADFSEADLSFADLSGARLGGARFDQARFDGAIWTDGQSCSISDCPR